MTPSRLCVLRLRATKRSPKYWLESALSDTQSLSPGRQSPRTQPFGLGGSLSLFLLRRLFPVVAEVPESPVLWAPVAAFPRGGHP